MLFCMPSALYVMYRLPLILSFYPHRLLYVCQIFKSKASLTPPFCISSLMSFNIVSNPFHNHPSPIISNQRPLLPIHTIKMLVFISYFCVKWCLSIINNKKQTSQNYICLFQVFIPLNTNMIDCFGSACIWLENERKTLNT